MTNLADELERRLQLAKDHGPLSDSREVYIPSSWLPALLASLTGEGEPVAWQRRLRNTAAAEDHPHAQWSDWRDCDEERVAYTKATGGKVYGFPELEAEVRPLYTRPVACPDREAVARAIGAAAGVSWAGGVVTYASTPEDDGPIDRFYRAADAVLFLLPKLKGEGQ